jgi:heat shock protein HslJ
MRDIAIAVLLLAAACSLPPAATPKAEEFREGVYLSTAVFEGGQPRPLLVGTNIQIDFERGFMAASVGCNRMVGPYALDAGRLNIEDGSGMTILACGGTFREQQVSWDQDMWLQTFLRSEPAVIATGETLVLDNGSTRVEMRRAAGT